MIFVDRGGVTYAVQCGLKGGVASTQSLHGEWRAVRHASIAPTGRLTLYVGFVDLMR